MNHRSNLDNILVSFLIARRTVLSYAVGEWARVWPLQSLVQSMGAFFVRRNSRNELYRKVLERYVHLSSRAGVCQAVFPEGKLSQDGELSEPKIGFIDYILRDYHQAIDRKVVFIPVGINYDRVIEDKSLLLSASPSPSKKSLWFILKTSYQFIFKTLKLQRKQRWRRFGYASVNFGQPIYATQFCDEKDIAFAMMEKQQRIEVVKSIAKALMDSIQNILPILPVPLMSELILKNKHQWISELDLKTQCVKRLKELKQQGAPIEISDSACEGVLTGALDILIGRGFVDTNEGLLKAKPEMLPVLKYYANSIVQWQSL